MIAVTLPWPSAKLNPNRSKGLHWAATSALRKHARNGAALLTKSAMQGQVVGVGAIALTITFIQPDRPRPRPRQPAGCPETVAGRRGRRAGRERCPLRPGHAAARVWRQAGRGAHRDWRPSMNARYTGATGAFDLIAVKQRIDADTCDQLAMAMLLALDAAKRGAAPAPVANTLTEHLLTSVAVWSQMGNKPLYAAGVKAWDALRKACARPTALLDLTTGEYAAISKSISFYVRALPRLEIGVLVAAQQRALAQLRG